MESTMSYLHHLYYFWNKLTGSIRSGRVVKGIRAVMNIVSITIPEPLISGGIEVMISQDCQFRTTRR